MKGQFQKNKKSSVSYKIRNAVTSQKCEHSFNIYIMPNMNEIKVVTYNDLFCIFLLLITVLSFLYSNILFQFFLKIALEKQRYSCLLFHSVVSFKALITLTYKLCLSYFRSTIITLRNNFFVIIFSYILFQDKNLTRLAKTGL